MPVTSRTSRRRTAASQNTGEYWLGFDIGGTFTDLVVSSAAGGTCAAKVLSRPDEITRSVVEGLAILLEREGLSAERIHGVVSGATTVVTNLIIERKGASTGLLTTAGFRDLVEIAREVRCDIYDLRMQLPDPLVPRDWRKEVVERVDRDGNVVTPLDEASVRRAVRALRRDGVEAVAVSFLHAYRYADHERQAREIIRDVAPDMFVSLSCDVLPEIREYERTIATVLNAYVQPLIGQYLEELERSLAELGVKARLHIMQSNGGMISREYAEAQPLRMLESGPAAGALAAAHVARLSGYEDLLSFDMGGTTAKSCLVTGAAPAVTTDFETARVHRFKKGSGLPVRLPVVDMMEIGAGGGSIARVDETGLLKVGPDSAGAVPGPACYGLGGEDPTVTDAALVLGYLDSEGSLSGQVALRPQLAKAVIRDRIADPLGMSVVEAASGIYRIVCEAMAASAKVHAVEKGKDVRRCTLVAFGGAGPMHAREVARRLGCCSVLIPAEAGVFSAMGLLVAPVMVDAMRTFYTPLATTDWNAIETIYSEMENELTAALMQAGVRRKAIRFTRSADMRYIGQGFEITSSLPGSFARNPTRVATKRFYETYDELFGHHLVTVDIEALTWRLNAFAASPSPLPSPYRTGIRHGRANKPVPRARRKVYFPDSGGFRVAPVYLDHALPVDRPMRGPALVEQSGCTIVVGPGERFRMDQQGNVLVTISA